MTQKHNIEISSCENKKEIHTFLQNYNFVVHKIVIFHLYATIDMY